MDTNTETIRGVLAAMKFEPRQIETALAVLKGQDQPQRNAEALLTPRQLCERLKISSTSLWRLRPPHIRVGGRKRFDWEEVRAFLADHSPQESPRRKAAA